MSTLQITHCSFLKHDTGEWHPERPDRMTAIEQALSTARFQNLITVEAPLATPEQISRAHPRAYFDFLEKKQPKGELIALDEGDTIVSPGSWEAALRAAGAAVYGVDEVMQGRATNAFAESGRRAITPRSPRRWASVSSTTRLSPLFTPRKCMARSASRWSISTFITGTARRRSSGCILRCSTLRPTKCRCFRALAELRSAAKREIS